MNYEHLEDWAGRVVQELQEFCDEAQAAAGNPDGEDQLLSVRVLIREYEDIAADRNPWKSQLRGMPCKSEHTLLDEL